LTILDFPVTTPPMLSRKLYEDYLDEKSIKQDYLAFLDGKPVTTTTTGGLPFLLSCLPLLIFSFSFLSILNLPSPLP